MFREEELVWSREWSIRMPGSGCQLVHCYGDAVMLLDHDVPAVRLQAHHGRVGSVTTSRNGPVAMRPAEDGAPLVAGAPPATLSPAPTALLVPQSLMCRPSFLHCWELQM